MPSRYLFVVLIALSGVSFAQDTNFPVGPQYLITTDSTLFLRPIATPSLSLGEALPAIANVTQTEPVAVLQTTAPPAEAPGQTDFSRIYWGSTNAAEKTSEIEISSTEAPLNLPASLFDPGVTGLTDPQSLRQRGYGLSLGEVAAYWKSHKRQAPRVFTNSDLARLRG